MNQPWRTIFHILFVSLSLFLFICFAWYVKGSFTRPAFDNAIGERIEGEAFDSTFLRLNTMDKLSAYCDSVVAASNETKIFPDVVSDVIRQKFYHGYSYYTKENNLLAVLGENIVGNAAAAIVLPDDIVKYPYAACSQQSIVGMELFRRKGYDVRKVAMYDSLEFGGHFTYEVYYDGSWHYFDTNQEPDRTILKKYRYPSVAFLAKHPYIVAQAYRMRKHPDSFERLVLNFKVGKINKEPAPNARLYQQVTKFFNVFGWLVVLAIYGGFILWSRKKVAKKQVRAAARAEGRLKAIQTADAVS